MAETKHALNSPRTGQSGDNDAGKWVILVLVFNRIKTAGLHSNIVVTSAGTKPELVSIVVKRDIYYSK